jgi:hypothetical protein
MAVTSLAKPGDFMQTFSRVNGTTPDLIQYGITADGKIYRGRIRTDAAGPGGRGTWVDTGLTIPDVSIVADL